MELQCQYCLKYFRPERANRKFCSLACAARRGAQIKAEFRLSAKSKICCKCKLDLPISEFAIKNSGESKVSSDCKSCHRIMRREKYKSNPSPDIDRNKARRCELILWLKELKSKLACIRCGFDKHPSALHFHHKDPSQKEASIARAIRLGWSKNKFILEINKCDVLCANCHAIEHAQSQEL